MRLCCLEVPEKLVRLLGGLVALIALAQYIQTINYGFVLDDHCVIIENTVTKNGFRSIPAIFTTSYRFGYPMQDDELYRPIPKAIFAALWSLSPGNPLPGHLLNIVLYALTGYLLVTVLNRFFPLHPCVSLVAAMLFIAHPIHTEVVANIKSLDEILGLFFFLVSLHLLHRYLTTNKKIFLLSVALCFFASLLSKESSITFLAIYPLFIFYFPKKNKEKLLMLVAALLITALIFLFLRSRIVGMPSHVSMADNVLMATSDFFERKATAVYILGLYLKLLLFPHPLTFDYSYNQIPVIGILNWQGVVSFVVCATLLVFALSRLQGRNLIAFGILFFFITSSIASNLVIYIGTHMGERLMYVPSLGVCFAIAACFEHLLQKNIRTLQKILCGAVIAVSLLFTLKTWAQNPVWKSNIALFESGVKRSPQSHRTHYYLGYLLQQESFYTAYPEDEQPAIIQRGIDELRKALDIYPEFADAYLQLGHYYFSIQQYDAAISYLTKARELSPDMSTIYNQLGAVYFAQKQIEKAIDAFSHAITLDPNYLHAYKNLGSSYGTLGKFQDAMYYFSKALQLDPNDADCYYSISIIYRNLDDFASEKRYRDRAAALNPQYR